MITGVSTIRGDADIAPLTVRHMFGQGVNSIWVAVGDEEAMVALAPLGEEFPTLYLVDARHDVFHEQQRRTDELAVCAAADWIVPFDADEYWFGAAGQTIAAALDDVDPAISVVGATLWHHSDWHTKVTEPERLPKIAYRWRLDAEIGPGNHTVDLPGDSRRVDGLLAVRHLQYRSFDHFCQKVADRNATLAPEGRARGDGAHHTRFDGATDAELWAAWRALLARASEYDPIPARR